MNLLSINDINVKTINLLFNITDKLKKDAVSFASKLNGKNFVLVFEKPSVRTRVSFEAGINHLGGKSIYLAGKDIGINKREPAKDIARILSRYADGIIARTFLHESVVELKNFSSVPVINALSDREHPCQALGDIYTVYERGLDLNSLNFFYIGDGNNVLNSLLLLCSKLGINIKMAIPKAYRPSKDILDLAIDNSKTSGSEINFVSSIKEVAGSDIIYTDVWTSMGQEEESQKRIKDFSGYQVNKEILKLTGKDTFIMHCLPANRGQEITDSVIESENSIVFDQAENRMHIQKAILLWCLDRI